MTNIKGKIIVESPQMSKDNGYINSEKQNKSEVSGCIINFCIFFLIYLGLTIVFTVLTMIFSYKLSGDAQNIFGVIIFVSAIILTIVYKRRKKKASVEESKMKDRKIKKEAIESVHKNEAFSNDNNKEHSTDNTRKVVDDVINNIFK